VIYNEVMAWKVVITNKCEKEYLELLKEGSITDAQNDIIVDIIEAMEEYGPEIFSDYVSHDIKDHGLTRDKKWLKHKSCSFSESGRLIYRYNAGKIEIAIVRITTDHDYS
jgi:mRNA-degrading endonuclease YafQ of YafQ-DinJ toxin-antitoxin module